MRPAPDHPSPANTHYTEYDGSGQMLREYGWKPGSLWGTDPAFFSTRNQELETRNLYYYLTDHLGTPHSLIDSAGATVWSATYDTFGQATVQIGSVIANGVKQSRGGSDIENNLRFPGQYFDPESGLYYNFHRYYSPTTGRYNRIDPIKDSVNWYACTNNNNINRVDNLGLACCIVTKIYSTHVLPPILKDGILSDLNYPTNGDYFVKPGYKSPYPRIELIYSGKILLPGTKICECQSKLKGTDKQ